MRSFLRHGLIALALAVGLIAVLSLGGCKEEKEYRTNAPWSLGW